MSELTPKQFTVSELIEHLQGLNKDLLVYLGHPKYTEIANDIWVGNDRIYIAKVEADL